MTGRTETLPTLLEVVQHLIDRLYDRLPGTPPAAPYVIGDAGYRHLYDGRAPVRHVGAAAPDGANVLLRPAGEDLRLAIYFPNHLIGHLERWNPMSHLGDENVAAFATFVEEVDHFALLVKKWRAGDDASLLELELHANVTKHFLLRHFLRRQHGDLPEVLHQWLDFHLYHAGDFTDEDPALRRRYQDARRLAYRYVHRLLALPPPARLLELRRWSGLPPQAKVARIEALH